MNLSRMLQGRATDFFSGQPDTRWVDKLPYAVLCIYMEKEGDAEGGAPIDLAQDACNSVLKDEYLWEITSIDEYLVIVIGNVKEDNRIGTAVDRANQLIRRLNDMTDCPVYGSISNIHETINQLQGAYQEASLAMDYGYALGSDALSRYDESKLGPLCFYGTGPT